MTYQDFLIRKNLSFAKKQVKEIQQIETMDNDISNSSLKEVKGIGEKTIITLFENGIKTKEQLKQTSEEEISKLITNPLTLKNILSFIKE